MMDDKTRIMSVLISLLIGVMIGLIIGITIVERRLEALEANMLTTSQTIYNIQETQRIELENQQVWAEHVMSIHEGGVE